ncbi:hypothetical protein Tco_0276971 [Tanacetum coccineum]
MDDPNITMAEYIQLEEEKSHRRGQEFNWETATYVSSDFENEFPAIMYTDALTSKPKVSSCDTCDLGRLALPLDMAMYSFYVIKWCAM